MKPADLFVRARRKKLLMTAVIELTYSCDLACEVCYNDRSGPSKSLEKSELTTLIEDLADLEVLNLVFTGGEPTRHPHFMTLGRLAKRLGFVVRIKTNGMSLDRHAAGRLKREVEPFVVDVSLHGASASTHDRQTRVRGSFDRLVENLGSMKQEGLRVRLSALLTSWNEHELEAMQAMADALEMDINYDCNPTPRDNGDRSPMALAPSRDAVRRMLELQLSRHGLLEPGPDEPEGSVKEERLRSGDSVCSAAFSTLAVDPLGNVLPCVNWRRSLGNIRERSIRDIWRNSPELEHVRDLNSKALEVVSRHDLRAGLAAFCPGLALAVSGDELDLYPAAVQRAELERDLMRRFQSSRRREQPEGSQRREGR
jgi:MoaA/NifB/PqqE/SkfB family radical SAM enzyme